MPPANAPARSRPTVVLVEQAVVIDHIEQAFPRVLEIPGRKGQLATVRRFLSEILRTTPGLPVTDQQVDNLVLAVNEAVSNVVEHAYGSASEDLLRIEIDVRQGQLLVRLLDHGRSFDPDDVPAPVFDGTDTSGLGLYMIRSLTDQVSYDRCADGTNCLTMAINLP
jgi:serine/threonine-protein kinase RsbW